MIERDARPAAVVSGAPTGALASEPAVTIAKRFADKTFVASIIAGVLLFLGGLGISIMPGLDAAWVDNTAFLVSTAATIGIGALAKRNTTQAGVETREHVYPTTTVTTLVGEALVAGAKGKTLAVVPPPPAEGKTLDAWVANDVYRGGAA